MSKLGISSLFKTILLTAALAVSFTASAFTEGTDYMVLEKPIPNADKTLIKVFSYACPFCYKYDKAVTGPVSEKVKDIVAFTPFHLETKGEYGKQASEVFAVLINKDKAAIGPLHACVLPVQASKADKGLKRAFSLCLQSST